MSASSARARASPRCTCRPSRASATSSEVVHVSDARQRTRARTSPRASGARWSSGIDELLADPAVEVVVARAARRPSTPSRSSPPSRRASARSSARSRSRRPWRMPIAVDRGVPRGAARRCSSARTTSSTRRGAGRKHHLTAPAGTGARDRGHAGAPAERPLPRRRHRARSAPAAAPARGGPDLDDAAGRGIRRPSADHRTRRARPADAARSRPRLRARRRSRAPSRRSATRSGIAASGIPVRLATVMLPDGADALWQPRDHHRRPSGSRCRSRPRSCTSAARRCSVRVRATGACTTYPQRADDGYLAEWRALARRAATASVEIEYDELLDDARYAISARGCRIGADPRGSTAMIDVVPVSRPGMPTGSPSPNCPLRTRAVGSPPGAMPWSSSTACPAGATRSAMR